MSDAKAWIEKKAAASLNPAQVENALLQLEKSWNVPQPSLVDLIENFPLGESALIHLIAISSVCATRLVQHPEILLWLSEPEISMIPRDGAQMVGDLHDMAGDDFAADNFKPLRVWKNREMIRIAVREIADAASLEETTAELSQVAEICIRRVLQHWEAELRQRHGSPNAKFAILAVGKLGGMELNYSSDVDLIFLYNAEGQLSSHLSYHQFFNRVAEKILTTFNGAHAEGLLFRVDLRLRPEGSSGPLARSLESMENYYSGFGETWERLALIKARGIAGSRELAYDFLRQHQPFIYPKIATPDLLEQIGYIKQRIERDVVGSENLHRDVKLGRGGIREIEFVVQTLQFIHGARSAFLQETSTLKALYELAQLELIPQKEIVELDRAYRFLRQTEHRLQIEAEQQTHTVPDEPEHLRRVALSLGFSSAEEYIAELNEQMQRVRSIFERVVDTETRGKESTADELQIFANQAQAERALNELAQKPRSGHVSSRTRQTSRKLRPLLLQALGAASDPDFALNQILRFVEAYGMRSMLFELLVSNPRLLELLVRTFDSSRFAGDLLVRHPHLLEEITRAESFGRTIDVEEHLKELRSLRDPQNVDLIRAYRQHQLLRIFLRDVLNLADVGTVLREQTALAEACLVQLAGIIAPNDLTIIALGKFGGRELGYGADLDVVFVGEDIGFAQKLLAISAQPSAEGSLPRIDTRLRPDGEKGPVVCSLATFEQYYSSRAQLWELQALTRARPVIGPQQKEFVEVAQSAWKRAGTDPELWPKIDNMLERIRRDRGSGSDFLDFKTGTGGIIEAEFLAQALQMRAGIWQPNWTAAVEELGRHGVFSPNELRDIRQSYDLLRRCESALRRWEDKTVSALPPDPGEQRKLAVRLDYANFEALRLEYQEARQTIHSFYRRFCESCHS